MLPIRNEVAATTVQTGTNRRWYSPLAPEADATVVAVLDRAEIVERWRTWAGIDISAELPTIERLTLLRCDRTGVEFVSPAWTPDAYGVAGRLRRVEEQLHPTPWEHDWAIDELVGHRNALVVGCGDGWLVEQARGEGLNAWGIDTDADKVYSAQHLGRPIECLDVADAARIYRGRWSAVVAMGILETVRHPGQFLAHTIELLEPGGDLLVTVPLPGPISGRQQDLTGLPPVAMSRWGEDQLRTLTELWPLSLESLVAGRVGSQDQPVYRGKVRDQYRAAELLSRAFPHADARALARLGLRRFGTAQRLYARYKRR